MVGNKYKRWWKSMDDFLDKFKQLNSAVLDSIRNSEPTFLERDRKGKGYVCPFCGNGAGASGTGIAKDPKHNGKWTCFKCKGEGRKYSFDVIDLYGQQTSTSDYIDKVKGVAGYYGWSVELPSTTKEFEPTSVVKAKGVQTMAEVKQTAVTKPEGIGAGAIPLKVADYTQFYEECSKNIYKPEAVEYLIKRGISVGTASVLNIGYCENWKSPTAIARGFNPPASARIIIPCNKNHYVARAIDDDKVQPSYRKMNENGNGAMGFFFESAVYEAGADYPVFVVEGAMDALSILEVGQIAMALNSTANAKAFADMLAKKPTEATLVLCLDNDTAGRTATELLKKELQHLNISFIVADICKGHKDPNEYLVADRDSFIETISKVVVEASDRPDNTSDYIATTFGSEIDIFKKASKVKTGFTELDKQALGVFPELYCIAGGTSLGKTTLTLQLADQFAEGGNDVVLFSLEQSRLEMVSKSLARLTFLENRAEAMTSLEIRQGVKKPILDRAIVKYAETIGRRLSIVEGNFRCNVSFIGDYVKRYIARTGVTPIVIIDYLQILQPDKEGIEDTRVSIDNAVTELKRMSRDLQMTVIVISSINRANYLTPIDFESLKGSGGIEYTAGVVWGLQLACLNEEVFTKTEITAKRERIKEAKSESPREIELVCLKNRYGCVGWSAFFRYYPASDVYVTDEWYVKPTKEKATTPATARRR